MAKKEDLYITKDGEILRGEEATDSLLQKDAEELLKEAHLESHIKRSKQESYTLRLQPTAKKSVKKIDLSNCGNTSINPHDISLNVLQSKASATGAKLSAWQHIVTGLAVDAGAEVSASVTAAQAKLATTDVKPVDIGVNASADVDIRGAQVRVLNVSAKGAKGQVGAAVKASAIGADVKVGNADLAVVDANLDAQISATAKGVNVQAAYAKVTGVQASAYAQAKAEATGADITAAKAKIIGVESERGVSASAEAKGVSVSAATANIVGIQDKKVAKVEAEVKLGPEVNVAQFNAVGRKTGGSVNATAEATLGELQAGTATLTGIDNTISASAQVKSDIGSLRVANVNAAASGGANFEATADLSLGLDVGNLQIGSNKGGSIGLSTRFQAGNIVLSSGLPSLTLAPSLNLGFGGGSRGSGSCGGKQRKGGSHSSVGAGTSGTESDSGSAGGEPNGGSTTVRASTVSGHYRSRVSDNNAYTKGSSAEVYSRGTPADVSSYSRGPKSISVHSTRSASYSGGLGGKGAYSGAHSHGRQPSSYSQTNGGSDGAGIHRKQPSSYGQTNGGSDGAGIHRKQPSSYGQTNGGSDGVGFHRKQPSSYGQTNGGSDGAGFHRKQSHGFSTKQPSPRPYSPTGSVGLRHRSTTGRIGTQPVHSPKSDHGVVPGSLSMSGNSHTSSGFGSTHRRYSSNKNGSAETKESYGERLASMLNQKVSTLAPANGAETDRKKHKKVCKDREEAKRELSLSLSKFREKLDEEDRSNSASASQSGAISKPSGNGKDGELGTKADSEDETKEKVMAPKERPFGSKKNIHTLGCFKNESTREVMKIGGNVHGFDP